MTPPLPRGAAVFLQAHSQYRGVLLGIARRLKARYGAEIHLFVTNAEQAAHYRRGDGEGLFADIVPADLLYRACTEPVTDAAAVRAAARENEAYLGLTINELAMVDRHLGRGYSLAGFYHPRSRMSEDTGYDGMLHGFNRQIEFWRATFDAKKPALVINTAKIPSLIARRLGVPMRRLAASRFRNLYYWAHNEFLESDEIADAFASLPREAGLDIEAPAEGHLQARAATSRSLSLAGASREAATILLQRLYWRARGYTKGRSYYMRDEIAMALRQYRDMRRLQRQARTTLADLEGKDFVFYPLHVEPEFALQNLSPEFFFQLAAIAALARDLPAGTLLAVKEHLAAIGRRPTEFIDQIASFKNVVLIRADEHGQSVVRRARAVATITSSAGFEAAVLGKPVVTFGRHNVFGFLPHVRMVRDFADVKRALADALSPAFDAERARRDGRRFLAAMAACSFDLAAFNYLKPDIVEDATVEQATAALVRSLAAGAASPAPRAEAAA
ncbi:MAG: hypothetical protein JNM29_01175 [Candidatus Odyssella sp.]|nr:hypothetical protein [Candidatus Odyssella sp.]